MLSPSSLTRYKIDRKSGLHRSEHSFGTITGQKLFESVVKLSPAHVSLVVFFGLCLSLQDASVKQAETRCQATSGNGGIDGKREARFVAENIKTTPDTNDCQDHG
mmetsp:Transcript_14602/g.40583  ORF Transcript_14602/g.40583 Transcript_14602/m.40583 type:complete len:105 (-) Transcript_14602:408-722(-)